MIQLLFLQSFLYIQKFQLSLTLSYINLKLLSCVYNIFLNNSNNTLKPVKNKKDYDKNTKFMLDSHRKYFQFFAIHNMFYYMFI